LKLRYHSIITRKAFDWNSLPKRGTSQPLLKTDSAQTPIFPMAKRPHIFLVSVALCAVAIFLYTVQQPPLPESYAVCSRTGNRLYTVDDEGSQVQCLAVHNSLILATGSLGERSLPIRVLGLTKVADDVKGHWSNHNDALGNMVRPPLLVRYIDEGSIIIPGMSGMSISY
jgi:hypothetical protein